MTEDSNNEITKKEKQIRTDISNFLQTNFPQIIS